MGTMGQLHWRVSLIPASIIIWLGLFTWTLYVSPQLSLKQTPSSSTSLEPPSILFLILSLSIFLSPSLYSLLPPVHNGGLRGGVCNKDLSFTYKLIGYPSEQYTLINHFCVCTEIFGTDPCLILKVTLPQVFKGSL